MRGQGGIGLRRHQRAQLRITSRRELGRPPRAWPLGQRLAPAMPGSPAVERAPTDAQAGRRFTQRQPRVKGSHQALTEVGGRASSHARSCHTVTSSARRSKCGSREAESASSCWPAGASTKEASDLIGACAERSGLLKPGTWGASGAGCGRGRSPGTGRCHPRGPSIKDSTQPCGSSPMTTAQGCASQLVTRPLVT